MAADEARKKWGTIFMGEREASVEQLDAMQEPLRRDKIRKEQTEDYMERVRKRAADRAREILGAAYTERLKVLDEARADAEASKRAAARECQKLKSEVEAQKKEAAEELREFRAELGQSLARVLQSLADQRKNLADAWRGELCDLACSAAAAGAGYLLGKEHKNILNSLVIQALHQLENRMARADSSSLSRMGKVRWARILSTISLKFCRRQSTLPAPLSATRPPGSICSSGVTIH